MSEHSLKLSIVMPVFNEEATVLRAVNELLTVDYPCDVEVIVVDDGSHDRTPQRLRRLDDGRVRVVRHPQNRGKGAALRTGAATASGTHLLPFDADREYDPGDIPRMLLPVLHGRCDVVFGCRLFGANTVYHSFWYAMGNRATTFATNVLFDACVSDLHTCLKLVPLDLFNDLELRESGFGLDTELAAGVLRSGIRPFEVPVSYFARTHAEGKKIGWRDGIACLRILGRVRLRRPVAPPLPGASRATAPEAEEPVAYLREAARR
jgi:glycosyltransferase involved in cell wall biosynthesis